MAVASLRSPWHSGHVMRAASTSRRTRATPRAALISWAPPRRPPTTSSSSEHRGDARGSRRGSLGLKKMRRRGAPPRAFDGWSAAAAETEGGVAAAAAELRRGAGWDLGEKGLRCMFYIAVLVCINRGKAGDFVWAARGARSSATRGPGEFLAPVLRRICPRRRHIGKRIPYIFLFYFVD